MKPIATLGNTHWLLMLGSQLKMILLPNVASEDGIICSLAQE